MDSFEDITIDTPPIARPVGRPKKDIKGNPKDIIDCEVCDKKFFRNNRYNHNKTKYHMLHKNFWKTMKNYLSDETLGKSNNFNDMVKRQYIDKEGNIKYLTRGQYNLYKLLNVNNSDKFKEAVGLPKSLPS